MLSDETLGDLDLSACNNGHYLVYFERGTCCPMCEIIGKIKKGFAALTDEVVNFIQEKRNHDRQ